MPQLQPGEYTKQSVADLLGWNTAAEVPQTGTARFYYNSLNGTIHCIDSNGTELLPGNGAVSSVNGMIGVVVLNAASVGAVALVPLADQTIIGTHQLINRGSDQTGPALTSFDSFIQNNAIDSASGNIAVSGQKDTVNAIGVQGIGQGTNAAGIYGLASDTTSSGFSNPVAGVFFSNYNSSANSTGGPAGIWAIAYTNPSAGTFIETLVGNQAWVENYGPGTIHYAAHYSTARPNFNTGGGVIAANYGYDVLFAETVGASNAAFHSVDQGSSANNYGILLDGVTHNDLGGGYTKVGSIAITSTTASTTSNIGLNAGIVEATGGVGGITLSTQSASVPTGQIYTIKKVDSGAGAVTISDLAGANFDGDSTYILADQWQYVTIQWNGSRWNVIGNN